MREPGAYLFYWTVIKANVILAREMKPTIAILLLALTVSAQSQSNIAGQAAIIRANNLGYKNPGFAGQGDFDIQFKQLLLTDRLSLEYAPKVESSDGLLLNHQVGGRFYFNRAFVSGGFQSSRLAFHGISKTGHRAVVGGGFDIVRRTGDTYQRFVPQVEYGFPDSTQNRVKRVTFGLEYFGSIGQTWGLKTTASASVYLYDQSGDPRTGHTIRLGIGLYKSF